MSLGNSNNEPVLARAAEEHTSEIDYAVRARSKATPNSYQLTGNSDNIDERDKDDPLCATAYVADMYYHFKSKEETTSVRPTFMESQPYINERMRAILIDWLIEVHLKFKLVPESLYLTVNLIDRYLEREVITRARLQLLGVAALLVASKYEEIYPPELRDLVYICDRAYTRNDVSSLFSLPFAGITSFHFANLIVFLYCRSSRWKNRS
jgi:hypothetical protein